MLKPINIPLGVAKLFEVEEIYVVKVTDEVSYRPDLLLSKYANASIKHEIINNYLNGTSPLSLSKGNKYNVTSLSFINNFSNM